VFEAEQQWKRTKASKDLTIAELKADLNRYTKRVKELEAREAKAIETLKGN
jgi:hypothetical protein